MMKLMRYLKSAGPMEYKLVKCHVLPNKPKTKYTNVFLLHQMTDLVWILLRGIIATSVNSFDTFRCAAPPNRADVVISLIAPPLPITRLPFVISVISRPTILLD
jgi:hypothetical protein